MAPGAAGARGPDGLPRHPGRLPLRRAGPGADQQHHAAAGLVAAPAGTSPRPSGPAAAAARGAARAAGALGPRHAAGG